MNADKIYEEAVAIQQAAAEAAYQSQLAYLTGNFQAHLEKTYEDVRKRLDDAYTGATKENKEQAESSDPLPS